jgi:hypothetical protein
VIRCLNLPMWKKTVTSILAITASVYAEQEEAEKM